MRPQAARLPERALAVWALVIASLHVDREDVLAQAARLPERARALLALVVSLFFVDRADVPLQVACSSKRARAMHALVIALLVVDRPHVCLQRAELPKRAPAMRALVVSAFLVDGAHMKSASTLAAERLPAMLARAIAARVRMRSWTRLFAGLAHGGGRAFKCQQRSPCLPQRVVMVGWGEIQNDRTFAPKQRRRRSSCIPCNRVLPHHSAPQHSTCPNA